MGGKRFICIYILLFFAIFELGYCLSDPKLEKKYYLFAVKKNRNIEIDPIATIDIDNENSLKFDDLKRNAKNIWNEIFLKGKEYNIFLNGLRKGKIRVREISKYESSAIVDFESSSNFVDFNIGIASNKLDFVDSKFRYFKPTKYEIQSIVKEAKKILNRKKEVNEYLNDMKWEILTFNKVGNRKLIIGSFWNSYRSRKYEKDFAYTSSYSLFIVLEFFRGKQEITFESFHYSNNEENSKIEDFLDIIDLDGDAFPEIITRNSYYESWDYCIYKKKNNKWYEIYKGGEGGV